jgi:hypothetical protein
MADVRVKVLEPADNASFLTLREAKLLLGMPVNGPVDDIADETLELQIAIASATIMRLVNRMMAKQKVVETWFDFAATKLFLRHFPVEEDGIEEVTIGGRGLLAPDEYALEEESGTLWGFGRFAEPVSITYWGGYELPDEAPLDLKQATLLMLSQQRSQATRESIEGIRMIAHKDSRVLFFDPNQQAKAGAAGGATRSGIPAVDALLDHYTRLWA